MNCLHCQAETTNGLALCQACQAAASVYLEHLPVYFRNLARQRRPGRPNGSVGGGGGGFGDDDSIPVTTLVGRASNDVDTWARALADDRGVALPDCDTEVETFAATCQLLADHVTSIATLEWAGQFVRDMARHELTLRRATETLIPGWYAGGCRRCGHDTYVVPGLTWVTCGSCGVTTFARDHLPTVLDEARDWVARPMRLAEAVVALMDTELSVPRLHKRISKWGERGQIAAMRRLDAEGDEVGPKRYQFGEVLDLLHSEGTTRLDGTAVRAS